jgi:hypothetical protein
MLMRIVVASALLIVLIGCSKKSKFTGASDDSASASAPNATAGDKGRLIEKDKGPQGEKPNWLNDPRFNKKGEGGNLPVESPPNGGKPGLGIAPPSGGLLPPNVGANAGNPGIPPVRPAQPAVPNPPAPPVVTLPAAGGKTVTKADLNDVWVLIDNASGASGKMPAPAFVYAALVQAGSPAADLVKGNYIILTGATRRESIWAYEKNAPTQGGWVATQNGPEQVSAAEFAQRLGR